MKDQKSPGQIVRELAEKYSHLSNSDFVALCMAINISAPDPTGGVMLQLELPLESCGSQS